MKCLLCFCCRSEALRSVQATQVCPTLSMSFPAVNDPDLLERSAYRKYVLACFSSFPQPQARTSDGAGPPPLLLPPRARWARWATRLRLLPQLLARPLLAPPPARSSGGVTRPALLVPGLNLGPWALLAPLSSRSSLGLIRGLLCSGVILLLVRLKVLTQVFIACVFTSSCSSLLLDHFCQAWHPKHGV